MSSRQQELFLYEYRAAIALNNMAVTLLERGAPRPALDTLKDCVGLMESALRQQLKHTTTVTAVPSLLRQHTAGIPSMLLRAGKRVSRAPLLHHDDEAVCVVQHDGTFLQAACPQSLRRLFQQQHTQSCAPVRLETFDHQCLGERNPELESGIMLYNFGLSYLCLSRGGTERQQPDNLQSNNNNNSAKLREVAAALFSMSYEIIARPETLQTLLDDAVRDGRCLEPRLDTRLRLAHLALDALRQAQSERGLFHDAADALYRLLQVSAVLREMGLDLEAHEACSLTEGPSLHAAAA